MDYSVLDILQIFCQLLGILVIFGFIVVLIIRLVIFIWNFCTRSSVKWCGGPNTWAVVTGSTDGIGLEYARQLAKKGYNLLLLSRTQSKLNKVKENIEFSHPNCTVRTLAVDFSQSDIWDQIEEELKNLSEIHVLVNNVAIIYPNERPEYFTQIPNLNQFITSIVNVNVVTCTRLSALILPRMVAKGRGIIINLSSFSAFFPVPLLALYSATKVYIDYFSRALHEEYKSKGITVQTVLPYYVSTNMSYNMNSNFAVPSAKQFVSSALKTVGRQSRTSGYPVHNVFKFVNYWSGVGSKLVGINLSTKFTFLKLKMIRNRIRIKEKAVLVESSPLKEERIDLDVN